MSTGTDPVGIGVGVGVGVGAVGVVGVVDVVGAGVGAEGVDVLHAAASVSVRPTNGRTEERICPACSNFIASLGLRGAWI